MEFVGSRRNGVMLKCEDNYLYKKSSTSKNAVFYYNSWDRLSK